jgi:exopolyphosphatase/guanosine-5'-triphosphate,3'-diphosphate pyrophosphatase
MAPVRIGVIDIGTNTTRLLVADVEEGSLRPVAQRRHFVNPSRGSEPALAALVEAEAAVAREAGAEELVIAGTAALRRYAELRRLDRACRKAGAGPLRVLSAGDEARLAFRGATIGREAPERIAVVDVGGGSTEIAIGQPGRDPEWWASRPLGSRLLTEDVRLDDPPAEAQLAALRAAVSRRLANLDPPEAGATLAVGGGTASLRLLCGPRVDARGLATALRAVTEASGRRVAEQTGIAWERVRLLPAALIVLAVLCESLPSPIEIAPGGVREGLALSRAGELAGAPGEP